MLCVFVFGAGTYQLEHQEALYMEGGHCGIEVAVRATHAKLVSGTLESRGLPQEDHDRASEAE